MEAGIQKVFESFSGVGVARKGEKPVIQTADPKMKKVYEVAESVAVSRGSVLITGESGTGKELLARFIHAKSPRAARRFVALNCAAVPDGLLESELFGYEKGAFTGADQRKAGKFEQAHESTFLLDEISELPPILQAKLLRVLQEGEVERLGGQGPLKVNVRIIATTNRALDKMVKAGEFREDLFYRLNVIPLHVPPLRSRPLDIDLLARHFLETSCAENGLPAKTVAPESLAKLKNYPWPGNVRELQNVMERSVLLSPEPVISAERILLAENPETETESPSRHLAPGMTVSEAERLLILKTLEFTNQNRTRAAEMLGISIRTLRNKLNEYKEGFGESLR
jgi:two-component system response regulator FlrC